MSGVNGRWCRVYFARPTHRRFGEAEREPVIIVTYRGRRKGRSRQLTVSPKLLRKVLR